MIQQQKLLADMMQKQQSQMNSLLNNPVIGQYQGAVPIPVVPPLQQLPQQQQPFRSHHPQEGSGKINIQPVPNLVNAQFTGMSMAPLMQLDGDLNSVDMSKVKRKLVSGETNGGSSGIIKEIRWTHHCVSKVSHPQPVQHSKQNPQVFFSGCFNKLLSEFPQSQSGSALENKMKYMSRLADLSINDPWENILTINAAMFRALEQGHMNWSCWSTIELWLERTISHMRNRTFSTLQQVGKHVRPSGDSNQDPPNKKQRFDFVERIPEGWIRDNKLCIMFQLGRCSQQSDHTTKGGNTPLAHVCAGCLRLEKGRVSGHGAKDCSHKNLF